MKHNVIEAQIQEVREAKIDEAIKACRVPSYLQPWFTRFANLVYTEGMIAGLDRAREIHAAAHETKTRKG